MNAAKCPICGKAPDPAMSPFCSKRCADVDLSRWFKGQYAIPASEPDNEPPDAFSDDED